jgi:parallel beta-helix repeat protein
VLPTDIPAASCSPNGIQIADGAGGAVTNNSVIDEIYSPCVSTTDCIATGSGILVFDSQGISVTRNHIGNTQDGIGVADDGAFSADDQTIENNVLNGSLVFDAIDLCGSNGGTISGNTVAGSGQSAIHLDSTCTAIGGPAGGGAAVSDNTLNEACAGILNGTSGNTISATNTFFNTANTILVGDSCTVSELAQFAESGQKRVRPQPARP